MKKTLVITALCAITALFSGCWKKKDKTDTMNSAMSTDAVMSDDKPIKVAALGVMSTEPSGENKLGENTNDEPAIAQLSDKEEKADDADKKADDADKKADEADKKANEAMGKVFVAKDKAKKKEESDEESTDDSENEGDEKKK